MVDPAGNVLGDTERDQCAAHTGVSLSYGTHDRKGIEKLAPFETATRKARGQEGADAPLGSGY